MLKTFKASIDEVRRGDGEKIIDFRLERVQEVRGVSWGDCRDFCTISSNLKDITEVKMDQFVLQTTVYISLFCVPDIVVHHPKHELHQGSPHGSVYI